MLLGKSSFSATVFVSFLFLLGVGCGGGDGSRPEPPSANAPVPAELAPGGIYSGDLKDGTFMVFKVLKIGEGAIVIKGYGKQLKTRPTTVPKDFDQVGLIQKAYGSMFSTCDPYKIEERAVTAAEEARANELLAPYGEAEKKKAPPKSN